MLALGLLGKATVSPAAIPLPAISSVPRSDTWCGFVPQWLTGTQCTLVMRTLLTCELAVGLLPPLARVSVIPPPAGAVAPPGLAAAAIAAQGTTSTHSSTVAVVAIDLVRLWAPA
jgi:hypothetical protein